MVRFRLHVLAALFLCSALTSAQITFGARTDVPVTTRPQWTAVADFDGDADNDLAVTADTPDRVAVLLNGGAGTFGAPATILVGSGSGPHAVVAVDLDGDADIDLAVTLANSNAVQVLFNNGAGVFTAGGSVATATEPRDMVTGDLDGDGDADLVCVCRAGNAVTVLLNDGAGVFTGSSMTVGADPRGLDLADFDADADLDLAVSSHDNRSIEVYSNSGSAAFTLARTLSTPNDRPSSVEAADLTGDGLPDLATTAGDLAQVFTSSGSFNFLGPVAYSVGTNPGAIVAADFDVDGDRDLITANEDGSSLTVLVNSGSGGFTSGGTITVGTAPQHVAAVDLDGNRSPDLVVANRDSDDVSILLNTNDGANVAAATFRNGTFVNTPCYTNTSLPVLGQSYDTEIDHGAHAGATATLIVYKTTAVTLSSGLGEVLVAGPKLLRDLMASSGTVDAHSSAIPLDPSLAGVAVSSQAVILGGGVELCNAIDLVVGF